MEIIVYYPETPEKQALFDMRVAKFHANYVSDYIEKLQCSTWQKLKLIDAIAETIEYSGSRVPTVRTQETAVPFLRKPPFRRWKPSFLNFKMYPCTDGVNTF